MQTKRRTNLSAYLRDCRCQQNLRSVVSVGNTVPTFAENGISNLLTYIIWNKELFCHLILRRRKAFSIGPKSAGAFTWERGTLLPPTNGIHFLFYMEG